MKKYNRYNRLIINSGITDGEGAERIFLLNKDSISEVAFNDEAYSYAQCYCVDENGYMDKAEDILYEEDFDKLYYKADETDPKEAIEMFETLYDDDPQPFVKASWDNHDHYPSFDSEHGINTSHYEFDEDTEIIEGICYKADDDIPQDYPHTEHQDFYRFVANDGREFYIKETHPFFIDESDYVFELISEEDFGEYDNGELYVENATSKEINSLLEDLSSYRSAIRNSDYITENGDCQEAGKSVEYAIKYGEWTEYFPYHYNFVKMAKKLHCIDTDEDGNIIDGRLPSKIVRLDKDGDSPDYTLICADKWMN